MKLDPACIPCLLGQALRAARVAAGLMPRDKEKELLDSVMDLLKERRVLEDLPALTATRVYDLVGKFIGNDDPYRLEKKEANRTALAMYPRLKDFISRSRNPLRAAAILAITGNILDRGTRHGVTDTGQLVAELEAAAGADGNRTQGKTGATGGNEGERSSSGGDGLLAVDHFDLLAEKLEEANNLLYIADNAGEIVLDRLFIEEILLNHDVEVTLAVRGGPIINDATMEDALEVGLNGIVRLVEGTRSPGLILSKASFELIDIYRSADVIVSKGQGNFEMLSEQPASDPIFFLFKVKCELLQRLLDLPLGSSVLASWGILSRRWRGC